MLDDAYAGDRTALLVVDPYNDFMSEGGKLYDRIKETAEAAGMFGNLRKLLAAVRTAGIRVFIVPHHRSHPGDFDGWRHMNPVQVAASRGRLFEVGSWGGEWHPEFGPQPATWSSTSTGRRAASPTPTSTRNSSSGAFSGSSWLG